MHALRTSRQAGRLFSVGRVAANASVPYSLLLLVTVSLVGGLDSLPNAVHVILTHREWTVPFLCLQEGQSSQTIIFEETTGASTAAMEASQSRWAQFRAKWAPDMLLGAEVQAP